MSLTHDQQVDVIIEALSDNAYGVCMPDRKRIDYHIIPVPFEEDFMYVAHSVAFCGVACKAEDYPHYLPLNSTQDTRITKNRLCKECLKVFMINPRKYSNTGIVEDDSLEQYILNPNLNTPGSPVANAQRS
jgi:hypothetical protein